MLAFPFRRLLPLALVLVGSLTLSSCVVRERGYGHERHDRGHRDYHDRDHDRRY